MPTFYFPGQRVPRNGRWLILKPGGSTELDLVGGDFFPPTPQKGVRYQLAMPL